MLLPLRALEGFCLPSHWRCPVRARVPGRTLRFHPGRARSRRRRTPVRVDPLASTAAPPAAAAAAASSLLPRASSLRCCPYTLLVISFHVDFSPAHRCLNAVAVSLRHRGCVAVVALAQRRIAAKSTHHLLAMQPV